MNTNSGTIYALSGEATATGVDGSSRALREGDGLHAGEAIGCGNTAAMLVNTASGEQLTYGPGSTWVVPEAWSGSVLEGQPLDAQSLKPQSQALDSARLESQSALANLYLSSGRAAGILSESLQSTGIEPALLLPDNLGDLDSDGAGLIEALQNASDLMGALNLALHQNHETSSQFAEEADQLNQLIQRLEDLRSSGDDWLKETVNPDWLTETMTPIFTTLAHAEARALEAYSSEVPGGPAWYGNGEPMRFNGLGSSHGQQASLAENQDALALGSEAIETLEIDAVLSSVTEHQLEDVLSFDRYGSQLKVSIQGESTSQNASTVAVVLNAQFESTDRAPWDSVFNPGTIGPDQG